MISFPERRKNVLDHGFVILRNVSGPTRRADQEFDAHDRDPANVARISFDGADVPDRPLEDDLKLARYLYDNRHTTPFEMVEIWLDMSMPLFIARQFVRHRTVSINEVSGRYTQLPNKFYIPDVYNIGVKSETNKQGRTIASHTSVTDLGAPRAFVARLSNHCARAYEEYEDAIKFGIPNELARCFLPVNVYTTWVWKQDLHNMMHFLKLRLNSHAQYEARVYANAIFDLLADALPETMKLFADRENI